MAEADVVSRIQSGRGRMVEPGDPVFTFVDVAKLVDVVALETTVNAEALHQDLNQLAARLIAVRAKGQRPDVGEGPHSQRQLTEWLVSQLKAMYKSHFHVDAENSGSPAGGKLSEPFMRFGRFVRDKLQIELGDKNIAP